MTNSNFEFRGTGLDYLLATMMNMCNSMGSVILTCFINILILQGML